MMHEPESNRRLAKVLVVDDDRQLLWALNTRLSAIGCDCVACSNASEAMVKLAVIPFDLVITDMTMPGIDGLAIVAMIRSHSDVPIIVVTGHSAQYGPLIAAYQNVTLFPKPLEPAVFLAYVKSSLRKISSGRALLKYG